MFRRSTVRYGKTPEPETPYQKAGQVWDERIGSARIQAKNWRLAFFGALEPSLCNDECQSSRPACANTGIVSARGFDSKRRIERPHVSGSQARIPQWKHRSADHKP